MSRPDITRDRLQAAINKAAVALDGPRCLFCPAPLKPPRRHGYRLAKPRKPLCCADCRRLHEKLRATID